VTEPKRFTYDKACSLSSVPIPNRIDGPQWNVGKKHDRRAGRAALEIFLQPLQLFVTERPHASSFQIGNIHETHEVNTFVIEAGPPRALGALPIALEILLAVVGQHVMLARHKENLFCRRSF